MSKLKKGHVVFSMHNSQPLGSWWLITEDHGGAIWLHGTIPPDFRERPVTTHWDDTIIKEQKAKIVPSKKWPEEVCTAVAKWHLTGSIDSEAA